MENGEAKTRQKRSEKRFEAILKSEMTSQLPTSVLTAVNPRLAECVTGLEDNGEKVTVARAVNMALILKALSGDLKSYELIRDTLGEKPEGENSGHGSIRIVIEDADNS